MTDETWTEERLDRLFHFVCDCGLKGLYAVSRPYSSAECRFLHKGMTILEERGVVIQVSSVEGGGEAWALSPRGMAAVVTQAVIDKARGP